MNISDFDVQKVHKNHPSNTFGSYEKESFMRWFLNQCFEKRDLDAVITTKYNEDNMVDEGFLEKVGEQQYRLTTKSKGLLYSVYGKSR